MEENERKIIFYFRVSKDSPEDMMYMSEFIEAYQDLFEEKIIFEQGDFIYIKIVIKKLPDEDLEDLAGVLEGKFFKLFFVSKDVYNKALNKRDKSASPKKEKKKKDYRLVNKNRTDKIQVSIRVSEQVSEKLNILCKKFGMTKKQLLSYLIMNQSEAGIFAGTENKVKQNIRFSDVDAELERSERRVGIGRFYKSFKSASDFLNTTARRVNQGEKVPLDITRKIAESFVAAEIALEHLTPEAPYTAHDGYDTKMFDKIVNCAITNPKNIVQLQDNSYDMKNVAEINKRITAQLDGKFVLNKKGGINNV